MSYQKPYEERADSDLQDELPPMMLLARKQALNSTCRFKLGAVITKKGRILGYGCNTKKTHPKYGSGRYRTLHCEGAAIYDCVKKGEDMEGATIWIYRLNNNLAKPCPCCQGLIEQFGITKAIYSGEYDAQVQSC